MAAPAEVLAQDAPSTGSILSPLTNNQLASMIADAWLSFSDRRAKLGLSNPGSVENISKEVERDVFLNSSMFTGMRAELTRGTSISPLFQTAHNFTIGSQSTPPYSFAALYGTSKVFLQGNIANDFALSAVANYRWSSALTTKMNLQLAPGASSQSMAQLEAVYAGDDFTTNIKAINPSILDDGLTGIFIGNYLQSITPRWSLGFEMMWQRQSSTEGPQVLTSYVARYKAKDWILSGQLLDQGSLKTSYWRRLSERVEAGVDLNLSFVGLFGSPAPMMAMGQGGNEGVATMGAKYDFRTAVFRGQVDNQGKVSCLLEKQISPPVRLTFAGEMDHSKNAAKVGLAIAIESAGEEVLEQQERLGEAEQPSIPFQ